MTEKEVRETIIDIMEATKRDAAGYCAFAQRNSEDEGAVISAACYAFIKTVIEDIKLAADKELPF